MAKRTVCVDVSVLVAALNEASVLEENYYAKGFNAGLRHVLKLVSRMTDDPTPAQLADLRRCVARCDETKGTFDYPNGDAIALRTGAALERRGWVVRANRFSANCRRRWLPTDAGRAALAEIDQKESQ